VRATGLYFSAFFPYDGPKQSRILFPFPIHRPRLNNEIRAPRVRVVGREKENLGVMALGDALRLREGHPDLDLIEIVPGADPPVVWLTSFDKYRYEREKAEKKERQALKTHATDIKTVQISARAGKNDLLTRLRKLEEFLAEGHPVEIQLRLRGREKGNKNWAMQKMNEFLGMIETEYKVIAEPKFGGRGMNAHIAKK
jgi:translation initiation factor IF-3